MPIGKSRLTARHGQSLFRWIAVPGKALGDDGDIRREHGDRTRDHAERGSGDEKRDATGASVVRQAFSLMIECGGGFSSSINSSDAACLALDRVGDDRRDLG